VVGRASSTVPGTRRAASGCTCLQGGAVHRRHDRLILGPFNLDRQAAAAAFRQLAGLDSDIACFGHGEPLLTGAGERLRAVGDLGPFA
jgi:hypothetical protein